MIPVIIAIVVIAIVALLLFRWFERYRYTEAWRQSEFRDWSFGFLMWFGSLFGHRLPPPPETKIEFATKDKADHLPPRLASDGQAAGAEPSGGPTLSNNAPDEEE